MKQLIFIIFFLFTQNVSANWISFYQSQIFEAKLLLSSVRQEGQKTQALIELKFKERISSDKVASHVLILEHTCGEVDYFIIEEKFYQGILNKSKEIDISDNPKKFKEFVSELLPYLTKQTCI
tara:strand:- start:4036 stop:4404 length:369 start_codon:yes stop_codon:yes gene_type:complete